MGSWVTEQAFSLRYYPDLAYCHNFYYTRIDDVLEEAKKNRSYWQLIWNLFFDDIFDKKKSIGWLVR